MSLSSRGRRLALFSSVVSISAIAPAAAQQILTTNLPDLTGFTAGDLVISTASLQASATTTNSGLDTASPITLDQLQVGAGGTTATAVSSLTLPQTQNGANAAISGEYGSASEGILQQSLNGQYLTIVGYGVNANTFNTAPSSTYGTAALGQTISVADGTNTVVPRVVALIGGTGSVDTTTALTGVFNTNNPRSAATVDGASFYVSGQGVTGDGTGGVFYATRGATTATPIDNSISTPSGNPNGTASATYGTETRSVQLVETANGPELYASRDFAAKGTPNDATDIRSLTKPTGGLPTSSSGLAATRIDNANSGGGGGNTASIQLSAATDNGINSTRDPSSPQFKGGNSFVYLSPEEFYFANPSTLYVADSGSPKNGSAGAAALGDGGIQKWVNSAADGSGTWTLEYDIYEGLDLANKANASTPTAPGVTGLFGLTGEVVNGNVELFATSYGLNELSTSYLYEVTDVLSNTNPTIGVADTFNTLYEAPTDTLIRGVAFAPTPEPASIAIFGFGLAGLGVRGRRADPHQIPYQ